MHDSLGTTLLRIRRFGNLHPLMAFNKGGLPLRRAACRPISRTVERDPGDSGEQEGRQTMSVIWLAARFTRLRIREGKAPMGLDARKPEWLPLPRGTLYTV